MRLRPCKQRPKPCSRETKLAERKPCSRETKLAERNARPPETAVFFVATALQRHKALQEKEQAKLAELEERAKNAAKAVDEAKQKGSQTPGGDRPAAGRHRAGEGTLGTSTKPCVTLSKSFPPTARLKISSHRWMQQLSASEACWRRQRRRHQRRTEATMSTWQCSTPSRHSEHRTLLVRAP